MSGGRTDVTFLLTAYNVADVIESVISEFYREISKKIPLKILVVEDGSTDGTKELLLGLSKTFPLDVLLGEERKGYSKAVIEGLNA